MFINKMPALSPRPLIGVAEAEHGYVSALQKFVTLLSSYDDSGSKELFLIESGDLNLAFIDQMRCDVVDVVLLNSKPKTPTHEATILDDGG